MEVFEFKLLTLGFYHSCSGAGAFERAYDRIAPNPDSTKRGLQIDIAGARVDSQTRFHVDLFSYIVSFF